jgi:hypothetical protein
MPPHAAALNRTDFQIASLHFNQTNSSRNKDIDRSSSSKPSRDNNLRVSLDRGWYRACRHAVRNFENVRPADATRGGPGGWRRAEVIRGAATLRTFFRHKSLGCLSKRLGVKNYTFNCRADGAVTPIPGASHSNGQLIVRDTCHASGLDCIAYERVSHRSRTSINTQGFCCHCRLYCIHTACEDSAAHYEGK